LKRKAKTKSEKEADSVSTCAQRRFCFQEFFDVMAINEEPGRVAPAEAREVLSEGSDAFQVSQSTGQSQTAQFAEINGWEISPDPFTPDVIGCEEPYWNPKGCSRWMDHALYFRGRLPGEERTRCIAIVGQPYASLDAHRNELDAVASDYGLWWHAPPKPHASIWSPGRTLFVVMTLPDVKVVWLPEQTPDLKSQAVTSKPPEKLNGSKAIEHVAKREQKTIWVQCIDMSRWDTEPVPQQQWAVSDRIPLHKTAIFSGEGAAGKSLLQLQMSVAHVLGLDWLGAPTRKGPALFIDAEDDEPVLHKRLADILRYHDATFADVVKGGLNLISLAGQNATLGWFNRAHGMIEPTPLFDVLLEMVGDIKPVMIGIASSADVYAGSEIDRNQVQQFVALLTRLAKTAGGSVVLISHPSLTGISSGSGLSGSTQWHNSVRARFYLETTKAEEGEQTDPNLREIHFKKNNYGPISESVPLRYENGLFLPVEGTAFDAEVKRETAKDVFLRLLRRFTKENRWVNANPGPSYAPALFAKELDATCHNVGKNHLAAAMRALLAEEKIRQKPYNRPSRPNFRLVIC
jgi:RecA-family ATPase